MAGIASLCLVTFWLALFGLVASIPVADSSGPILNRGQDVFSIPLEHKIPETRQHPSLEYYKTLSKYKIPIPDRLAKVVSKHLNLTNSPEGSIPAIPIVGDLEWLAPASIGTPPQQLYLDFDTGSADTWVFSTDTLKSMVRGQTLYDPTKSNTAILVPNCTWSIIYGDFSSCEGVVYKDTFSLGAVSIPNMTIESAESVSSSFVRRKEMSGLVGLAWSTLIETDPPQPGFLDFLPGALRHPLFTTDLRHNSSKGSWNFGYIDDELHGSDIEYIDIDNSDGFWSVKMNGFAVGGSPFRYEFNSPPTVILDTGTTLFYAPDHAVDQYFQSVAGANFSYEEFGYTVPCNSTPPDFTWELGDASGNIITGTIPGAYMIYAMLDEGQCYAGLQSLGGFSSLQGIFGDVFLKSGFQVWDVGKKRFGSAPKLLDVDISFDTKMRQYHSRKTVYL
ncbi:aspartic peptidase domain-containing protein [Pseudomassariella vexata]|uniref:Aspartic peptidase domain-containing protein n=1 Tax=Pseudomassariella vexata TaxID=1141098 RepID=A0A1Y2DZ13_9PEZI|nr:aspartic peptidase domain-containing protein [Pseudomassariella vexata]ORY64346.1 aspartic peptidase domain-containing protein [Pseudomassariella vexata]